MIQVLDLTEFIVPHTITAISKHIPICLYMAYITKQTEVAMSVVADYLMYNFSIRKWYGGGGGDGLFIQIHIPSGISPKPTDS